jgi:Nif-specific regulatory protein
MPPVLETMDRQMGLRRGTLTLLNRTTGELCIEASHGLSPRAVQRGRWRAGEGLVGKVAQSGRHLIVRRISDEPDFLDRTGARRGLDPGQLSFICVPIKLGGEVVGTLSADRGVSESEEDYQRDLRLLATIASMIAQALRLRQNAEEERQRLLKENSRLQEELSTRFRPSNIIGTAKAMRPVYDLIERVSRSDATVLILGESGVGKELIAQGIHYSSPRASRPFIKVNCAAIPQSLLASELFGHEVGAFTGAVRQRKGRFEQAHGGSIFLDEVGDLPAATQAMLLRVLQEREFERVGGNAVVQVDVRVIAATHRDLQKLVAEGKFREDLCYRLDVVPIHVPPLRERATDIPLLADFFVERYARANNKTILRISTPAIDMLTAYHWPGNVRELENCIERAVLLSDDEVIHSHHLPPTLQTAEATGTSHSGTLPDALARLERELLQDALKEARGNCARAARALDISERVMGLRVRQYGIDPGRFRTG